MLFKYVYNPAESSDNQPDSLVRYCSAFSHELSLEKVRELIEDAEQTYLAPYLSDAFLAELQAAYDAYPSTPLPTKTAVIIRKLQEALAYFVAFDFAGNRGLQLSDTGPGEVVTADGSYVFSRQWRTQYSLRKFFSTANRRLDRALAYLQVEADTFTTWKNSNAYAWRHDLFFNTAAELADYLPMEANRIVYLTLRPHIKEAEQRYIYRAIGDELCDEIKAAMKGGTITADQTALLGKIRYALVHWARLCAIPNLRLRLNQSGLVEPDFDVDEAYRSNGPSREETTRSLWISDIEAGREFLSDLRAWLWQNAAKFPTYQASAHYVEDTPPDGFMTDWNAGSTGVASFL